MFQWIEQGFADLISRGGMVMWPLLGMSLVSITLCLERGWFWFSTHRPGRHWQVMEMARLLREGQTSAALALAQKSHSFYSQLVTRLLSGTMTEALVVDVMESQRPRLERFMPTLSTVITAAPMLGILGTVLGIISSFQVIAQGNASGNPGAVSLGIAEALLTTAAGLVVALIVLLPYNAFRAQIDRAIGRMEMLVAAAQQHAETEKNTTPPIRSAK